MLVSICQVSGDMDSGLMDRRMERQGKIIINRKFEKFNIHKFIHNVCIRNGIFKTNVQNRGFGTKWSFEWLIFIRQTGFICWYQSFLRQKIFFRSNIWLEFDALCTRY